ncbi:MAG TPA: histidine phosphatase family protein [Micropepsaceae bacterium]|nr:histidine phosphatase family protein [Micropepsaceae bacterium]
MTEFLLVRHAEHALQNRVLVGRNDDAPFSAAGLAQLTRLADALSGVSVAAVHSSPRQRARETAAAIAAPHFLAVDVVDALDEIDYGAWTGLALDVLEGRPDWHAWNRLRAVASPPLGESMQALQQRVLAYLDDLRKNFAGRTLVLVSHAEPIRAALLHAMSLSLNDFSRIDVSTASITRLQPAEHASPIVPQWKVS